MILTIAIPTYNRPEKVRNTVSRLIPQLNEQVGIMILDNCSEVPVKCFLEESLGISAYTNIRVIRHKLNIGGDANIARCFELCETSYIWTLGDDDEVNPDAVAIILEEIENYKDEDLVGINFDSSLNPARRTAPIILSSTHDIAYKLDYFWNWVFLSSSVYKTDEYRKYLSYSAWWAYSMASQLVPTMLAISRHKKFVLSEKYIVTNVPADDPKQQWSNIQLTLGLTSLLEAPVGFREDEYLAFGKTFDCIYTGFGNVLFVILRSLNKRADLVDDYHIYLHKQIYYRTFRFRRNKPRQWLVYHLVLILLRNKWLLKILMKNHRGLQKKVDEAGEFQLFRR